ALALRESAVALPVTTNSALMYGYHDRQWAADWEGWSYTDTISDRNTHYQAFAAAAAADGREAGSDQAGVFDIGRLRGAALAGARARARAGVLAGLERARWLPAATGRAGTLMGFGRWDRGALKGEFLVMRTWRGGRSVECDAG